VGGLGLSDRFGDLYFAVEVTFLILFPPRRSASKVERW
jgi:hypothetical protein